jgi:hypothetical protein
MDITPLLMKDKCSKCKSEFITSTGWLKSICPSCVIDAIEERTSYEWICPEDPAHSNINSYYSANPDEWYHVVDDKNTKYRLVSQSIYLMRPWKFKKIYFSNKLAKCVEWIKRRKDSLKS